MNYSIKVKSKSINVEPGAGFSAVTTVDFDDCLINFKAALSGNAKLSSVKNGTVTGSIEGLFAGDEELADLTLSFSGVQNANAAFSGCSKLSSVNFKDSEETLVDAVSMFEGCEAMTKIEMNTPALVDSTSMFAGCKNLTGIVLTDLSSVQASKGMFAGCTGVTALNASLAGGDWDFAEMNLDNDSIVYIAEHAATIAEGSIAFNESASANTDYWNSYDVLTGKGWTVTPSYVGEIKYTDEDGTGEGGIVVTEESAVNSVIYSDEDGTGEGGIVAQE